MKLLYIRVSLVRIKKFNLILNTTTLPNFQKKYYKTRFYIRIKANKKFEKLNF